MKNIEWTDITINCVVGCSRGCPYCYAKKIFNRFNKGKDFSKPQKFLHRLDKINKIKNKRIFMNSMSDFMRWDDETIRIVNKYMWSNPTNKYIFLSKYHFNPLKIKPVVSRIYIGYTIVTDLDLYMLLASDNVNDFNLLNIEPLHENIECIDSIFRINKNIELVIIGAETGNRKNKVIPQKEWIERIINTCEKANVPVFLKENIKKYL